MNYFSSEDVTSDDKVVTLYSAVVWSVGLKRKVKVVIVGCLESGKKTQERKVFFSIEDDDSQCDMIQRFIRMSGMRPHRLLNTNNFKELLYYGVSDAA